MFRNDLKIALRNLRKFKAISFINLFGLTVGLTCYLLIAAYIINEVSYDKSLSISDSTFRLPRSFHKDLGVQSLHPTAIAPSFGPYLKTTFPKIQKMTRLLSNGNTTLADADKKFYESKVLS